MKETLYIQIQKSIHIDKPTLYVSDIGELFCQDKTIENEISHIVLKNLKDKKGIRVCMNAIDVVKEIQSKYPNVDVNSIGEPEFIVEYAVHKPRPRVLEFAIVFFVAAFTFLGSMYAIMAYNNDVGTVEIFENVYEFLGLSDYSDNNVLEIAYGIGLALGIIVFYNHFGSFKITKDPTPIQVEMDKYQKDIDDTLIDRTDASK
ncbi:MAG: hypothetical protein HFJ03_06840 [Lachnospira sp.]|mgnify:FL=1|jgi:stage V sporulation protein AA|nr:hypothetical protein [Lachnospira sp.]